MYDILVRILADGLVAPIVLLGAWALVVCVPKKGKLQSYSRVLMAGLTAYLVAKLIASIYQPDAARPFQEMGVQAGALYLNNPGFPSDHLLFCTAISLAVWFETRQKKLAAMLGVLTILVAIGRVVALVHTPLDVIGGIVFALVGIPWYLQKDTSVSGTREKRNKRVE